MCEHEVVNQYQGNRWCEDCGAALGHVFKVEDFLND